MIKITENICPQKMWNIKCPYMMTPTRIVIHNTYNDASAMNEINYMNRNTNYVSFHYAVDDLGAVQGLPLNRNGWHAGDGNGKGNREGIAIEICYSLSGGERYYKAEENAVILTAWLMKKYGWSTRDKITKHKDYMNKNCPHRILDEGRWSQFQDRVLAKLTEMNTLFKIDAKGHSQNIGWHSATDNVIGTVGRTLRLEAFSLNVYRNGQPLKVTGSIHLENIGDIDYSTNLFGTVGEERRLEAIKINVDAPLKYRVHQQDIGWTSWTSAGSWCGTKGQSKRIEAIEFKIE